MSNDRPRPPDVPPPPAQKAPDAAAQGVRHARTEATMTQRPDRTGVPYSPQPPLAVGPNPDLKAWREAITPARGVLVDASRLRTDGEVNLQRVAAVGAARIERVAAEHKASGSHGGVSLEIRLRGVTVGKGSEAVALDKALRTVGAQHGVHVRVTVELPNRQVVLPGGPTPAKPIVPGGGPGGWTAPKGPGGPDARTPDKNPQQAPRTVQPPRVGPPVVPPVIHHRPDFPHR